MTPRTNQLYCFGGLEVSHLIYNILMAFTVRPIIVHYYYRYDSNDAAGRIQTTRINLLDYGSLSSQTVFRISNSTTPNCLGCATNSLSLHNFICMEWILCNE